MNADFAFGKGPVSPERQKPATLALGFPESLRMQLVEICGSKEIRLFTEEQVTASNVDDLNAACVKHGIEAIALGPQLSEAQETLVNLTSARMVQAHSRLYIIRGGIDGFRSTVGLLSDNYYLRSELEREASARKKIFSLITHDLRSPFSSIIGVMRLLLADYENMKDEDRKDFLRALLDSANSELGLLDRLSQWGRSLDERVEPNMRKVPLDAIAGTVCRSLQYVAEEKHLTIASEIPLGFEVFADADLAQLALEQIVKNAVSAAPTGSRVRLFMQDCESDKIASILVEDMGEGFPKDSNPFEVSRKSTDSSLGVGLSMATNLARIMKGYVRIEKSGPGGTLVALGLPKTALSA